MVKYAITHDGRVLYTLSSNNSQTDINMANLMLKLSDENEGAFYLWRVENDPETGREKYTQIAIAKNGGLIS